MYDFVLVANLAVFAVVVALFMRQRAAAMLHPAALYLAFHGFVFVIRPVFSRLYDFSLVYRLYGFIPTQADRITVIVGANLAMLTFVAVSLRIASEPARTAQPGEAATMRGRLAGPILLATALLAPLGIMSQLENWRLRADQYNSMVVDAATGVQVNIAGTGWFTEAALLLAPLAVLLVWLSRYRLPGWACFAVFAILQAGTGGRGPLIYALLAIAVLYLIERGRRWIDWRLVALALAGVLLFKGILPDRGASVRSFVEGREVQASSTVSTLAPLEDMDFANMEYFEFLVWAVPQRTGSWDYFANNLQVFTEPVPRSLWKNKPFGSPVQFYRLWDYGTPVGMTMSVPGVGWVSFGWLGIIVQAGAFALLYAAIYRACLMRRGGSLPRLTYALIAGSTILVFRDGTIVTFMRVLPFYLGPLLIVWLAVLAGRRRGLQPRAAGTAPGLGEGPGDRRRALAAQAALPRPSRR